MATELQATSAVSEAVQAFLRVRRPKELVELVLVGGTMQRIGTSVGTVVLQKAGNGPTVLLLHGWEGQASDMAAFASPLLEAGYAVAALHLPGHGASEGSTSSIPHSTQALLEVGQALGALHSVIAHSVGSAVAAEAMHAGLDVERAVLIAAPAYYEKYARGFAAAAGLDAVQTQVLLERLSSVFGIDVQEICLPRRAPYLRQKALFIHSADDRVVSIEDSLVSAKAWPGAKHLRVEGLGHRRLLSDDAVIRAAVQFSTAP